MSDSGTKSSASSGSVRAREARIDPSPHPSVDALPGHLKRTADIALAGAGLLVAVPLSIAIAIAVGLTSPGPVFYGQTRVGLAGRRFTIFKFRTMTIDAEPAGAPRWAVRADPRATRVGAVLRRTGLDELPQLLNVLRGDMSLVGPRPERPDFVSRFSERYPGYADRLEVRPGITGFAQIHGWRGNTDMGQRLRHDLHYVRNWSLSLDARILVSTFRHAWSERTRDGVPV